MSNKTIDELNNDERVIRLSEYFKITNNLTVRIYSKVLVNMYGLCKVTDVTDDNIYLLDGDKRKHIIPRNAIDYNAMGIIITKNNKHKTTNTKPCDKHKKALKNGINKRITSDDVVDKFNFIKSVSGKDGLGGYLYIYSKVINGINYFTLRREHTKNTDSITLPDSYIAPLCKVIVNRLYSCHNPNYSPSDVVVKEGDSSYVITSEYEQKVLVLKIFNYENRDDCQRIAIGESIAVEVINGLRKILNIAPFESDNPIVYPLDRIHDNTRMIKTTNNSFIVRCRKISGLCCHKPIDIIGLVDIKSVGKPSKQYEFPASYCEKCNLFYVYESVFQELESHGKILCPVIENDAVVFIKSNVNNFINMQGKTVLSQKGYSVSRRDNLSKVVRQTILEQIIERNIMTRNDIIYYLNLFIQLHSNDIFIHACAKWEEDLHHIKNYKKGSLPRVNVDRFFKNKK